MIFSFFYGFFLFSANVLWFLIAFVIIIIGFDQHTEGYIRNKFKMVSLTVFCLLLTLSYLPDMEGLSCKRGYTAQASWLNRRKWSDSNCTGNDEYCMRAQGVVGVFQKFACKCTKLGHNKLRTCLNSEELHTI